MSISMISKIPVSPFIITVTVVLIFPAAMRLGSDAIVMEILFHLINHFSYQLPASQIPGTAKNQERLQEILLYVEENYRHPILLEDIAGKFGLNREYFCRFFKKILGKSPITYINEYRIKQAIILLQTTDSPVMDICLDCGFNNLGNFLREFKKDTGFTPLQYRKHFSSEKS